MRAGTLQLLVRRHELDRGLLVLWSLGLLIRFSFLPFTFHTDLYQIYSRSYWALTSDGWLSWSSQLLAQVVHNAWLLVILPLLPDSQGIWSATAGIAGIGAQPDDVQRFLDYSYLARALFLLKLPYLVGDVLVGWLLTRLVQYEHRRLALALWWLNPIVIYTSAVFGRHDSLWVALTLLGAYFARVGRRWIGLLVTVLAAGARFFPFFLLPFYLVSFRRSWREVWISVGLVAGFWLTLDGLVIWRTGVSPTLTLLRNYPQMRYLIALALPVGGEGTLPLFPLVWTVFLLWWLERAACGSQSYEVAAASSLCLATALTPVHPQYVVWAIPFAALSLAQRREGLFLAGLQAFLFLVWLNRWGASVTVDLLLPLGQDFVQQLPDPQLLLTALVPSTIWQPVVRTLFVSVTLWIGWLTLRGGPSVTGTTVQEMAEVPRGER